MGGTSWGGLDKETKRAMAFSSLCHRGLFVPSPTHMFPQAPYLPFGQHFQHTTGNQRTKGKRVRGQTVCGNGGKSGQRDKDIDIFRNSPSGHLSSPPFPSTHCLKDSGPSFSLHSHLPALPLFFFFSFPFHSPTRQSLPKGQRH